MREQRREGRSHTPAADNAPWKLLWMIAGAVTFSAIMFFLDLISTSENAPSRHLGE